MKKKSHFTEEGLAKVIAGNRARADEARARLKARWADPEERAGLQYCQRRDLCCRRGHLRGAIPGTDHAGLARVGNVVA
jgi:hypothetical protein